MMGSFLSTGLNPSPFFMRFVFKIRWLQSIQIDEISNRCRNRPSQLIFVKKPVLVKILKSYNHYSLLRLISDPNSEGMDPVN